MNAFRGILIGLVISAALWAVIAWGLWWGFFRD